MPVLRWETATIRARRAIHYNCRVVSSENCAYAGAPCTQQILCCRPPARPASAQRVEGSSPSMIRFLQTDNRMVKALIVVVIGAASVTMVLYLIPGLGGVGSSSPDTYAVVYPHWYSRILSSGDPISQAHVEQITENQLRQRNPQYASNPMIVQMFEQQVGQQLVQQQVLLEEAHRLGISATDDDVRKYLRTGPTGQVLYPNGTYIGDEAYKQLIDDRLHESVTDFEDEIKRRNYDPAAAGVHYRRGHGQRSGSSRYLSQAEHQDQVRLRGDLGRRSAQDDQPLRQRTGGVLQEECGALRAGRAGRAQDHLFRVHADQIPGGVPQPTQQADPAVLQRARRAIIPYRSRPSRATFSSACPRTPMPRPMPRPRPRRRWF